jgi:NDP-sugar pyrophosphorylase family protein
MSAQAVVLAGGLGTRLRPATAGLSKTMVPVRGALPPLAARALRDRGIEEALLLTVYGADVIHAEVECKPVDGLRVGWSAESSPLGTGGALRNADGLLQPRFVLLNGDTFLDIDDRGLLERAPSEVDAVVVAVCAARHGETDDPGTSRSTRTGG